MRAKTDWTSEDTVKHSDMNDLGKIINSKETPSGAQQKADNAEQNAKQYTDEQISLVTGSAVPSGVITMWSGSLTSIPSGWALCDGQNGTPDLRDRFIVGAGGEYKIGDTGGEKEVVLTTSQMPSHSHGRGTLSTSSAGSHNHGSGTLSTSSEGSHSHGSGTLSTNTTGSHTHSVSTMTTSRQEVRGGGGAYRDMPSSSSSTTTSSSGSHSHSISGSTSSAGSHSHSIIGSTSSAGSHSHSISGSTSSAGSHSHSINGSTGATGGGQPHENRPPYYALAYIMKL